MITQFNRIRVVCVAAHLFLIAAPLAAQDQAVAMPARPTLPHTKEEQWPKKRLKLDHPAVIYDSWKPNRKVIRKASRGTILQGFTRLNVVYEPDIVRVTEPMARFGVAVGDTLFRYTPEGETFYDFWIKGRWYESLDGSFITDLQDSGCSKQCSARETRAGRNEWWTKVRTRDGLSGWIREDLNIVVDPAGAG
jgi:hypothetical protein